MTDAQNQNEQCAQNQDQRPSQDNALNQCNGSHDGAVDTATVVPTDAQEPQPKIDGNVNGTDETVYATAKANPDQQKSTMLQLKKSD